MSAHRPAPPPCACGCTCCGAAPDAAQGSWMATALRPQVQRRALYTALLVGTLLILIHEGTGLLAGHLPGADLLRMGLTYLVPYLVATSAAVAALRR